MRLKFLAVILAVLNVGVYAGDAANQMDDGTLQVITPKKKNNKNGRKIEDPATFAEKINRYDQEIKNLEKDRKAKDVGPMQKKKLKAVVKAYKSLREFECNWGCNDESCMVGIVKDACEKSCSSNAIKSCKKAKLG